MLQKIGTCGRRSNEMRNRWFLAFGLMVFNSCGVGAPGGFAPTLFVTDFQDDCPGYSDQQIRDAIASIQQAEANGITRPGIVPVIRDSCNVNIFDPAEELLFRRTCEECFAAIALRVYGF